MRIRSSLCLLALALVLGACGDFLTEHGDSVDNVSVQIESGISGQVLLGPMKPVQSSADLSGGYVPYQTEVRVLSASGDLLASVETNEKGVFQLALAPGEYTLVAGPESEGQFQNGQFPRGEPTPVVVSEGALTEVTILMDTGIR